MGRGFISSPEIDLRQSILGTLVDSIIQFFCLKRFFLLLCIFMVGSEWYIHETFSIRLSLLQRDEHILSKNAWS